MSSFGRDFECPVRAWGSFFLLVLLGALVALFGITAYAKAGNPGRRPSHGRRLNGLPVTNRADLGQSRIGSRIVGGRPAEISDWPFFTSLSDGPLPAHDPYCGASLVGGRWVLTAAHCVANSRVVFATIGREKVRIPESPGERHRVRQIFVHPSYDEYNYRWDAALLRLPRRSSREPIGMVEATPGDGESVKVAGYGLEREGASRLSSRLKETELKMVGDDRCLEAFSEDWLHVPSMICAWELDTDSCNGDSGGPLVHEGLLVGLVSWGVGCARPDAPGVYTRVEAIRAWIDEVIRKNGQGTVLRSVEKWRRAEAGTAYLYGHFSRPVRSVGFRFGKAVKIRDRAIRAGRWVKGLRDGLYAGITDVTRFRSACSPVTMKAHFDDRTITHSTRICLPR